MHTTHGLPLADQFSGEAIVAIDPVVEGRVDNPPLVGHERRVARGHGEDAFRGCRFGFARNRATTSDSSGQTIYDSVTL